MPKPHVHLIPPPLSLALDARRAGNEAHFVSSGCQPGAVLRPVLCRKTYAKNKRHLDSRATGGEGERKSSGLDGLATHAEETEATLSFAIFTLRDLKAREEVVLGWEWDDGAVVHELPALIESSVGEGPSKVT